ncbi:MAG: hypothetical protein VKJ27_07000 [Synechocystis sp.]|nr:hypothetical protein [Synechocystis sp.]
MTDNFTIGYFEQIQERRQEERVLAFCQVLDLDHNLVGVSFDLTSKGLCVSLPNSWTDADTFVVILKRLDNPTLPSIRVTVKPMWRHSRNDNFDEIGGQILDVDSQTSFEQFLDYCQQAGPSGLLDTGDNVDPLGDGDVA